ncbi:MAG: YdeI/OmpD-associated family protein [Bacteroidota bacterium]
MQERNSDTFCPKNRKEWRKWLQKNHNTKESVWLVYYKKNTGMPTITWSEAVDEALCFGWIDSKAKPVDEATFMHFFCKRKAKGTWSKINKEKIERLSKENLMAPAGLAVIEAAKQNGSWTILDEVEELIIPNDLAKAFKTRPGSKAFFLSLSKSVKKMMLSWLVLAKREETRQKRIEEIADHAAQKLRPKQFR